MKLWKNKKNRPVRLDRRPAERGPEAPGDNWPVFDLDLLEAARKDSLLVARLFRKEPRWESLKRK